MAIVIDGGHSGDTMRLEVNQVVELRLPENPTTGYRWAITSSAGPAFSLDDGGFLPGDRVPGRGGEHVWQLRALAPGEANVQLTYRRGFAPDAQGNTIFTLRLVITPAPPRRALD